MTELRHGYTLDDLDRLARSAAGSNYTMAADYRDLYHAAWSAIVDLLIETDERPEPYDLARVGKAAIWQLVRDHRQTYGYRDREWDNGIGSAPRFAMFWYAPFDHGPESAVVERTAVPQILAALTERQRQALTAVAAVDGDRTRAAAALGINEKALDHQLRMARRACLALWLEGETPRQVTLRRLDYRRHRGEVAPCGTRAAMFRHRDRKERLCEACAPVEVEYDRERKARRHLRPAVTP